MALLSCIIRAYKHAKGLLFSSKFARLVPSSAIQLGFCFGDLLKRLFQDLRSSRRLHAQFVLNKKLIIHLAMGLAMFVATVTVADSVVPTPTEAQVTQEEVVPAETTIEANSVEVAATTATTEEQVRAYFSETPILAEVARCESHFRQFDENGQVLRGKVNAQDVGVMQINEHYHLKTAQQLGLDIHTLEGNMAYAKYLYDTQGTRPWNYSSACWSKHREVALK